MNPPELFQPKRMLEDIHDPIHLLRHAQVMIEHNSTNGNIRDLYDDALFLISLAIDKIEEREKIQKKIEHERAEYQRANKG